ncbi:hypothetical protein QYE76_001980 [Lolium multiflorum]|uniref:Uncharacterized protein n=1 Tax=Lolium multiflorum TaxID=4521 RepID=A0AAD8RLP5_LOLMU|nr:hypothetical protein QYE76_001980 [Lolium multiflorum]
MEQMKATEGVQEVPLLQALLLGVRTPSILYSFPSLQPTASAKGAWLFYSKANASERAMVAGLGGLYFVGVIFLGNLLKWLLLLKTNSGIARRNKAREGRAQELVSPEPSPRRKLFPMLQI